MSKVLFPPEFYIDKVAGALRVDGATHLVLNFPLQWAFKLNYSMRPIYRHLHGVLLYHIQLYDSLTKCF